jgi:DNA-binding NtrC family response regulator
MVNGANIQSPETNPLAGVVIYIVDDDMLMAEVVAKKLEMEGARPVVFHHSLTAWETFLTANPRPKLLVTDYLMKSLNGMELIERCKQIEPDLKTVLYSGSVGLEITRKAKVKPDHFLPKPFNLDVLGKAIRILLGL